MGEAVLILVSCADGQEAARIARALVDGRLAACVHLRAHEAIYRWRGEIELAPEIGLLVKTVPACAEAAMALIRALHSYELPAIMCVPVQGDAATSAWLSAETMAVGDGSPGEKFPD